MPSTWGKGLLILVNGLMLTLYYMAYLRPLLVVMRLKKQLRSFGLLQVLMQIILLISRVKSNSNAIKILVLT